MKNEQQKEKQYFILSNAQGHPSHFCYLDETGVFCKKMGTGKFIDQFDNLHDAFLELGAARLERCAELLPVPEELLPVREEPLEEPQNPHGIPGATRSESAMYLILKNADTYIRKEVIVQCMQDLTGASESSFKSTMHHLRKKMPHNESIEYKRNQGYILLSKKNNFQS